eukprot:Nk52_evm69s215 gene=Nk52_evmTU69s215
MSEYSDDFDSDRGEEDLGESFSNHVSGIGKLKGKVGHDRMTSDKSDSESSTSSGSSGSDSESDSSSTTTGDKHIGRLKTINKRLNKKVNEFKVSVEQSKKKPPMPEEATKPRKKLKQEKARIFTEVEVEQINSLQNLLNQKELLVKELTEENRTLKRMQQRQEKALQQYDKQDAELPQYVHRHEETVRSLKLQAKKYSQQIVEHEKRLKSLHLEMTKFKEKNDDLQRRLQAKGIPQREQLLEELKTVKEEVNELKKGHDTEIKKITLDLKTRERELKNVKASLKKTAADHKELLTSHQDVVKGVSERLQEKEKEIDMIKQRYNELRVKQMHAAKKQKEREEKLKEDMTDEMRAKLQETRDYYQSMPKSVVYVSVDETRQPVGQKVSSKTPSESKPKRIVNGPPLKSPIEPAPHARVNEIKTGRSGFAARKKAEKMKKEIVKSKSADSQKRKAKASPVSSAKSDSNGRSKKSMSSSRSSIDTDINSESEEERLQSASSKGVKKDQPKFSLPLRENSAQSTDSVSSKMSLSDHIEKEQDVIEKELESGFSFQKGITEGTMAPDDIGVKESKDFSQGDLGKDNSKNPESAGDSRLEAPEYQEELANSSSSEDSNSSDGNEPNCETAKSIQGENTFDEDIKESLPAANLQETTATAQEPVVAETAVVNSESNTKDQNINSPGNSFPVNEKPFVANETTIISNENSNFYVQSKELGKEEPSPANYNPEVADVKPNSGVEESESKPVEVISSAKWPENASNVAEETPVSTDVNANECTAEEEEEKHKQKELLLQRLKAIDAGESLLTVNPIKPNVLSTTGKPEDADIMSVDESIEEEVVSINDSHTTPRKSTAQDSIAAVDPSISSRELHGVKENSNSRKSSGKVQGSSRKMSRNSSTSSITQHASKKPTSHGGSRKSTPDRKQSYGSKGNIAEELKNKYLSKSRSSSSGSSKKSLQNSPHVGDRASNGTSGSPANKSKNPFFDTPLRPSLNAAGAAKSPKAVMDDDILFGAEKVPTKDRRRGPMKRGGGDGSFDFTDLDGSPKHTPAAGRRASNGPKFGNDFDFGMGSESSEKNISHETKSDGMGFLSENAPAGSNVFEVQVGASKSKEDFSFNTANSSYVPSFESPSEGRRKPNFFSVGKNSSSPAPSATAGANIDSPGWGVKSKGSTGSNGFSEADIEELIL